MDMDGNSFFWKLGAFGKFDFKRFGSDAEKVKVLKPKAVEQSGNSLTPNSAQIQKPSSQNSSGSEKTKRKKRKKKKSASSIAELKGEEIRHLRNKHHIHVSGEDVPAPLQSFDELHADYGMNQAIVLNVQKEGYLEPTAVQRQTIPAMFQGRDVMACAPTGSGKTAAFILPILHHLHSPSSEGFRALVLAPTRELAKQILREFRKLSKGLGLRSCFIETEKAALKKSQKNFDILVSTPNRLVYLLEQAEPLLSVSNVEWLVVDESDKLFEAGNRGFRDQLGTIYKACSSSKLHRAMFSATFAHEVEQWCRLNLDNVLQVYIGGKNTATTSVGQELTFTGDETGKLIAFRNLVQKGISPPVLVFVQSKERAKHLYTELKYDNINIDVIHSDRPQEQRDEVMKNFRLGHTWVLICTDLMGRGIDFKGVNLVINYDFPTSAVSYIHRIGRTGRAGRQGKAVTFFTEIDKVNLRSIANVIREAGCPVPEFMTAIKKPKKKERQFLAKQVPQRNTILTMDPKELERLQRKRKFKHKKAPVDIKRARQND